MLTVLWVCAVCAAAYAGYFFGHSMGQSQAGAFWREQFEKHLLMRREERRRALTGR